MNDAAKTVLDHLTLDETQQAKFLSVNKNEGWAQVFGGQLMAQALGAAQRTVPVEKRIVAFHASFTSRVDVSEKIEYSVEHVREGRRFATRNVVAKQTNAEKFDAKVSFQTEENGLESSERIPDVAPPEACATLAEVVDAYREIFPDHLPDNAGQSLPEQAIEMRFANIDSFLNSSKDARDHLVWIRFDADVGPDPEQHKQILAYASDQSLSHIVAQPHGLGGLNPKLSFVSLEHNMWFHRPFRADEWLLLVRRCQSATSGRAIVQGEIFRRDGTLVALLAQEALVEVS
jgi:acyl-CoA thioesterase II